MTLSQRLTRAGLTFVLFGTVAAVLPQQDGAARAADCVVGGVTYAIYQGTSTHNSAEAYNQGNAATNYNAYLSTAPTTPAGNITGSATNGTVTPGATGTGTASVAFTSSGTANLTATVTSGSVTYTATATVSNPTGL